MARFSPFDVSPWAATAAPAPTTQVLQGVVRADVCVVGAGYSGLTTALELARKGVRVVVLEAREVGFGGAGRNAGHCTPTFIHYSLPGLRRMLGEPWAERLIARQTQANTRVADMVEALSDPMRVAAEWLCHGCGATQRHPGARGEDARLQRGRREDALRGQGGGRGDHRLSALFFGGWFHSEGGHLNPLGYARGLARAAIQEGAGYSRGRPWPE
jgi:glycine/D-amino acid oxidase-like deaminating enzyme